MDVPEVEAEYEEAKDPDVVVGIIGIGDQSFHFILNTSLKFIMGDELTCLASSCKKICSKFF